MVAELAPAATLPLLYEPDRPEPHGRCQGWRHTRYASRADTDPMERHYADDAYGAKVQHAIARYVLGAARRPEIAAELGVSETTAQYMFRGSAWGSYGRPVLRALRRLGITTGRGDWTVGATRAREIVCAQRSVMRRAAEALDGPSSGPEARERLLSDLRLLSLVRLPSSADSDMQPDR